MKTIIETNKLLIKKQKPATIQDVRSAVISFLIRTGMDNSDHADESISEESSRTLRLSFDCANSEYTRAISLLMLLSSIDGSGFYIKYGIEESRIYLNVETGNDFKTVIDFLNKNWKITIED